MKNNSAAISGSQIVVNNVRRVYAFTLSLCLILTIINLDCNKKSTEPEKSAPGYQPKTQTAPESTLANFYYAYNFCQNGFAVDNAIAEYLNCFSSDTAAPQYEFEYWATSSTNPVFWILADEMNATARMFSNVDQQKLNLNLMIFNKDTSWVETAADTATQEEKHPTEDWYVYKMDALMHLNYPSPSDSIYLVEGNGLFYIRRCADGFYRIVRWEDLTGVGLSRASSKSTSAGIALPGHVTTWGDIKAMYKP